MNKLLSALLLGVVLNVVPLGANHYVATDGNSWMSRIFSHIWRDGLQLPKQKHSIEEFIVQLVRNAREKGNKGVIAFLEEAAGWGFAVDSAYYDENANGSAMLVLAHFMVLNESSRDVNLSMERLAKALRGMHSIVSPNDVVAASYNSKGACSPEGNCFSFAPYVTIVLKVPAPLNKEVRVDVSRHE
jgi:hypothetical protein